MHHTIICLSAISGVGPMIIRFKTDCNLGHHATQHSATRTHSHTHQGAEWLVGYVCTGSITGIWDFRTDSFEIILYWRENIRQSILTYNQSNNFLQFYFSCRISQNHLDYRLYIIISLEPSTLFTFTVLTKDMRLCFSYHI